MGARMFISVWIGGEQEKPGKNSLENAHALDSDLGFDCENEHTLASERCGKSKKACYNACTTAAHVA